MLFLLRIIIATNANFDKCKVIISPKNYNGYYISTSNRKKETFTVDIYKTPIVFIREDEYLTYKMYVKGIKMCVNHKFQLVGDNPMCLPWTVEKREGLYKICTNIYDNFARISGIREYCLKVIREDFLDDEGNYMFSLDLEPMNANKDNQLFRIECYFSDMDDNTDDKKEINMLHRMSIFEKRTEY